MKVELPEWFCRRVGGCSDAEIAQYVRGWVRTAEMHEEHEKQMEEQHAWRERTYRSMPWYVRFKVRMGWLKF